MTIPAALSIAAGTLGVVVALLSWRLARAPGWEEMRRFALVAFTAGVYCVCEVFNSIGAPDAVVVWTARIGMAFGALHGPGWVLYLASQQRRSTRLWERSLVAGAGIVAILSVIPGVVVTDQVSHRELAWLGVTYSEAAPSTFGMVVYAAYCSTLLLPLGAYVRQSLRGAPAAMAHAVGLACLAMAACSDALVGAGMIAGPYLLPVGFTVAVLFTGGVMLGRFVDQAREFEVLSRALETKVAQRTDELARTQDALLRAEKLAALGRLAAGAAHEINNPCSVVSTNLAYLRHSLVQDSVVPEDADRCLEESIGAAERIASIIRHLVDAGRVGGTARVDMHVFSVRQAVEKAVAHARVGMTQLAVLEVSGERSVRARGDATLLHQIIVNLVINAGHAIEARGRSGQIRVKIEERSSQVLIDVQDDGTGIHAGDLPRVFEPFFTTKRPGQGMGLGLAVSLGLARTQGGDIVVASTSPSGTTMRVFLEGEGRSEAESADSGSVRLPEMAGGAGRSGDARTEARLAKG